MRKNIVFLVVAFVVTLVALSAVRGVFLWVYAPESGSGAALIGMDEVLAGLVRGARFDAKWTAIASFPSLAILLVTCWLPCRFQSIFGKVSDGLIVFCTTVLFLLSLINFGFFGFYGSPINSLIFGLAQDDTWAIIVSIVKDWPVVQYFFILVLFSGTLLFLRKLENNSFIFSRSEALITHRRSKDCALVVCVLLVCVLFSRGTFGTFPLRQMDLNATTNLFVNQAIANGGQALYDAVKERRQQDIGNNPLSGLQMLGFATEEEALAVLPSHQMTCTQEKKLPNVVLVVMEAMGKDLFDSYVPGVNDTLGAMAQARKTGDLFLNALSIQNGTFPSLEGILFNTPLSPISQSRYGYHPFGFSHLFEFKKAGYRTIFLTSGTVAWRNTDANFPRQGFDEVLGYEVIKKHYGENIETGAWGIPDAYMFRYAQEVLAKAEEKGEPLFLVCLSTTNHPPYRTPEGYRVKPLSYEALPVWKIKDRKMSRSIMETYQYAADSLGHFILDMPPDIRGETIIVATGDHNTRTIFEYPDPSLLSHQFGVPLFFSVPKAWRPTNPDTRKWVGHFDIFPTLRELVLKRPSRPFEGRNVYSEEKGFSLSFSSAVGGQGIAINEDGAVANLAHPQYFSHDASSGRLVQISTPTKALLKLRNEAAARMGLADARVRKDCLLKK